MRKNIKIIVEYDGTNYAGWQIQPNAITIQEKIQDAIKSLVKEDIQVIGCSRTDAGVHAKGFVGNFFTESSIPAEKFKYAINDKLPFDIVVLHSEEVDDAFHARYNSKGKKYVYTVLNRQERAAINRTYVYSYKRRLDLNLMREGCKYFLGTHEFDSFRKKGSSVKSTTRTIYFLDVIKCDDEFKFIVCGNGFLYNMVRIIVGTLLDVGIGKIKPEYIKEILLAKDRTKAGVSVPAQGLCLQEVYY